jgi:hypothetical protein
MLFPRITDIWRCLQLPDNVLAEQIIDAMKAARDPAATARSSLYNHCPDPNDRHSRACRVAWRVAFRCVRETGGVPLVTLQGRRGAGDPVMQCRPASSG